MLLKVGDTRHFFGDILRSWGSPSFFKAFDMNINFHETFFKFIRFQLLPAKKLK